MSILRNSKEKNRLGDFVVKLLAYSIQRAFSLELLTSYFDVFSRIAIIWNPFK